MKANKIIGLDMKEESENVELKRSTSELKESIISIAAILNKHKEGRIYFGIANNGKVLGQSVSENTLREVSKAISDYIEPKIFPFVKKEKLEGKDCVIVRFKGQNTPYFAYGRDYVRVADQNKQISASELKKIILENKYQWETEISEKTEKDIDKALLKQYIARSNKAGRISFKFSNVKSALTKLTLLKRGKLLNAGEALFGKEEAHELQCAVFAGVDKITFLDIKQYKGNIMKLIELSKSYIFEHMNWRAELTANGRKEIPEVPERAIEEAVVNSLCHRDYSTSKSNEIAFYNNRIEISNPGHFPENLTPTDYIKGDASSVLKNPLMANVLYYSKDIERWGSGIKRIYEACKAAKVKVDFKDTKTGFVVVFYRKTPSVVPESKLELSGTLSGTLKCIRENPGIQANNISDMIKRPIDTVKKQIKQLADRGMIIRKGSKKTGGYWVIK